MPTSSKILVAFALIISCANLVALKSHDEKDHWSYDKLDEWPELCKNSKIQSPVDLSQKSASKETIPHLTLEPFENCDCLEVNNNGHTVVVSQTSNCSCKRPKMSGAKLHETYKFDTLHFHWPSEHTINGLSYPLEAHFVFYADKYTSFLEASRNPHGVTVLGVLFEKTDIPSNHFKLIADAVKPVSSNLNHTSAIKMSINLQELLPKDKTYFTYEGSLTTPNCAEHVHWIVFVHPSHISSSEHKELTNILDDHKKLLVKNNRPLQALNGRTIYIQDSGR